MSRSKKIIALFLSIVMVLGLLPASAFAANDTSAFSDVKTSAWYHEDVQYVSENGLMKGTGENLFSPDATTTRGMIVTILYRLEGEPSPAGACPFQDVASGKYYEKAITWAAENGIVSGFSADTFGPDQNITREQMAAILYRYATYKKYDVSTAGDLSKFPDADKVSSYAVDAMKWANAAGLINGSNDGKLYPAGNATRVQVAAILTRFCKNIAAQCTVTFQLNYGSEGTYTTLKVAKGDTITAPKAPTRSGYTFSSWSEKTSGSAFDFKTPIEKDITLYAQRNKKSSGNSGSHTPAISNYTVTFESNGGSEVEKQVVKAGSCATRPNDPEREGYRLVAWYIDDALTTVYDFNEPVNTNITLYASWEELIEVKNSFLDQNPPDVEIYSFDTDVRSIVVGESKVVTFEAEIFSENKLSADEVVLYQDGEIFAIMHDDGTNGDKVVGDGVYIYQATLSNEAEVTKSYQVKVCDTVSEIRDIGFYVPMTNEELSGMQTVDGFLKELVEKEEFKSLTTEEKAAEVIKTLTTLVDRTFVVAGSIDYNDVDRSVHYEYSTGALGVVVLEEKADLDINGSSAKSIKTNDVNIYDAEDTYSASNQSKTLAATSVGNNRNILILNGFENKSYRRNFYNNLKTEWDERGLNTTIDVNVTVADMKNLNSSDWDVIVFAMHGAERLTENTGKQSVLCLNETPTTVTDADYDYELTQIHTVLREIYTDGSAGYEILPQFFTDSYGSRALNGIMFFSETCLFYGCDCQEEKQLSPDYTMANALIGRSAEVVVGYHNSVSMNYSRDVMKIVIEESFNGATIDMALNTAKKAKGDNDNRVDASEHKFAAYPLITGNGGFVLRSHSVVKGSVKNANTSAIISNALIRAYDRKGDKVASTRSDSSGSYSLNLPTGTYTLEISAGSYKKGKIAIAVDAGRTTYVETFLLVSNTFNMGSANGTITNSITEASVSDVTVKFRRNWNNKTGEVVASTSTNTNGYFEVNGLKVGLYTIEYYKYGYATAYKNITVLLGSTHNAVISPVASSGVYRIVLTWGENPNDLDSHVIGNLSDGSSFHTYYGDKSHYDGDVEVCNLDVDDTTSYGPETITLTPSTTAPYYYYVYRFSGSGSISTSGAQIKLYNGDTLVETFNAPTDQGTSDYWNVFAIVGGRLVTKNTITDSPDITYAGATGVVTLNLDEVEEKAIVP